MRLLTAFVFRRLSIFVIVFFILPFNGNTHSIGSAFSAINAKPDVLPVRGKITDPGGNPLIGASVLVKGGTAGTTADQNGEFSLEVDRPGTVLVFSLIGYTTREVPAGETFMNIVLTEDNRTLSEVVVIGYGVQKKADLTGAVSTISAE